jgi:hypothetical protein
MDPLLDLDERQHKLKDQRDMEIGERSCKEGFQHMGIYNRLL